MFWTRSLAYCTFLLAPLLSWCAGCGTSVQQAASTGRGTIDFARFACTESGFTNIEFEILFGLMDAAGTKQARLDFISDRCDVRDTPCLICLVAIGETF